VQAIDTTQRSYAVFKVLASGVDDFNTPEKIYSILVGVVNILSKPLIIGCGNVGKFEILTIFC
jgi:hypothetical protein